MSGFVPTDLIKQVKIRPGIYNKDALVPPRREHRQQLWLEVAESLTPADEWESYTEAEKEMRIGEVSNKWKNLRDHFYREVKLLENGDTNKKRKYIYYNEMEFVRPYIGYKQPPVNKRQKKSNESLNDTVDSRDDGSDIDMGEFLKSKKKVDDCELTVTSLRSKTLSATKYTPKTRHNKKSPSTTSLTKGSQKDAIIENFDVLGKTAASKNPTFKIREGDISFCLSLVPTLRQMSDVRKLSAKIDILKILHRNMAEIECNDQESNARHVKMKDNSQDTDCDDLVEECEEGITIKPDPLNASGNTKVWW